LFLNELVGENPSLVSRSSLTNDSPKFFKYESRQIQCISVIVEITKRPLGNVVMALADTVFL